MSKIHSDIKTRPLTEWSKSTSFLQERGGNDFRDVQEVVLGNHVILQQGMNELKYKELITAYSLSNSSFNKNLNGHKHRNYSRGGSNLMKTFKSVHVLNQIRDPCAVGDDEESLVRERTMA